MSKENPTFEIGKFLDPTFEDLEPNELVAALQANAVKIEEGSYTKRLSQNELGIARAEIADVDIKIDAIETKKKEVMDDFKEQLKEPKARHKELLEMIKNKSVRKNGLLYLIDDLERELMFSFDKSGICVDVRPMSIQERQLSINSNNPVKRLQGTDNE